MLQTAIAAAAVFAAISAWVVSTQRRLVALDENAASALYQLGVQMSCRFDALTALLSIASAFAGPECQALAENVRTRRGVITGRSTPEDVLRQEEVLAEALERLARIAERYPELKASRTYQKTMGAAAAATPSSAFYTARPEKLRLFCKILTNRVLLRDTVSSRRVAGISDFAESA